MVEYKTDGYKELLAGPRYPPRNTLDKNVYLLDYMHSSRDRVEGGRLGIQSALQLSMLESLLISLKHCTTVLMATLDDGAAWSRRIK